MAEYKYLDKVGLAYLWNKIKNYVNSAVKVTGVKGNAESTYRTGNVNLTAANIGLGNVENKSSATIRGEITDSDLTGHANAIASAEVRKVGQATFNSAITTVTTNTLIRKGNVVQCELRWTTPSTQTSSQPVCTIPTGYRPTTRMYANAIKAAWTITNGTCPVVLQTSGAVTHINTAFTTNTSYALCATWITDNTYPS